MKKFLKYILLPLLVGAVIGFLISPYNDYGSLNKPPLSPPSILFPIVWIVLYLLMGTSSYIISKNGSSDSLKIYYIQLFVNALWSVIFFIFKWYFISVIWIILLLILIVIMIRKWLNINKVAAYLQIPYLIWTIFATYLTIGIYILN